MHFCRKSETRIIHIKLKNITKLINEKQTRDKYYFDPLTETKNSVSLWGRIAYHNNRAMGVVGRISRTATWKFGSNNFGAVFHNKRV